MTATTRVNGFSETDCGCGNLLPLAIYNRGWRYLRGHRGELPGESPKAKALRLAAKNAPKPGPVSATNYALTLAMVKENIQAARARQDELIQEEALVMDRAAQVRHLAASVAAEISRLCALRDALEPFVEPCAREVAANMDPAHEATQSEPAQESEVAA